MTNSSENRDSSVMMSSVMPSLKYSWPGSPLMLVKARTAIEGLSGRARYGVDGCELMSDAPASRNGRDQRITSTRAVLREPRARGPVGQSTDEMMVGCIQKTDTTQKHPFVP